ncbi:type II toxin-antitoxin system CcdA family antitoxin [Enterobacter sp.]|uniref:type II toxin-antitoxin system CcdA family antitoxin n=1 Tax=Enterobacter sp. TaxID=42895 RepID=UPI003D14EB3A
MTVVRVFLSQAREAGINPGATLATALDAELRHKAARKWKEENMESLDTLNRFHYEHSCFSDDCRTF